MIRSTLTILALLLAIPTCALAQPTAVSSSAQLAADPAGDAAPGADITSFALSTDAAQIHFTWTFAAGADLTDQSLAVCAVGHARTMCIAGPARVRIGSRLVPAKVSMHGRIADVTVSASALGYGTARSRTVSFRAKTGLMLSACPIICTDFSALTVAGYVG
jgi:hypothetical protein